MKNLLSIIIFILFPGTITFAYQFSNNDNDIPIQLTPNQFGQETIRINGTWKFNPAPSTDFFKKSVEEIKDWSSIIVPGEWKLQGYDVPTDSTVGYMHVFTLPETWRGQRIKIRFEAVHSKCDVYLNGEKVGNYLGAFTSFEVDITDEAKFDKENILALSVTENSAAEVNSKGSYYAKHGIGGIIRNVDLFAVPKIHLSDITIKTIPDNEFENWTLSLKYLFRNQSEGTLKNAQVKIKLQELGIKDFHQNDFPEKTLISLDINQLKGGEFHKDGTNIIVEKPNLWHAEHPFLYLLIIELTIEGELIETVHQRFGFRSVSVKNNKVFVNGAILKLKGVCRHSSHPLTGRSITDELVSQDIELYRSANINFIRTSHYPCEKKLVELCDEYGIFIFEEAPVSWSFVNFHQVPQVNQEVSNDLIYKSLMDMYQRDKNHPCIIAWSQANESKWNETIEKSLTKFKELNNDGRLLMFSHSDYFGIKGEEIINLSSIHYPGWNAAVKFQNHYRPVIFDEFLHVNAYNQKEFATDPGVRGLWGIYADKMWTSMFNTGSILGGAVWGGIDEIFFLNNQVYGFGPWGVIDGWRRPKPEYWGLKKSYSPIRIQKHGNYIENDQIILNVENRYLVNNFSNLNIEWKYQEQTGEISSDIKAGNHGHFIINLKPGTTEDQKLHIKITDHQKFIIDEYDLYIGNPTIKIANSNEATKTPLSFDENEGEWLIKGEGEIFTINKTTGLINIKTVKNEVLVKNGPYLLMTPLDNNKIKVVNDIPFTDDTLGNSMFLDGLCKNWECEYSEIIKHTANEIQIKTHGKYDEAKGSFTYIITSNNFDINYRFVSSVEMQPRQLGLVFEFDETMQNLSWNRNSYWSYYPDSSIDRMEGLAKAFYNEQIDDPFGPRTKPDHSWKNDATKHGSNDFRSTKHNIKNALLLNKYGNGIKVYSESATQHVRCWVSDTKSVYMMVANYSHAGAEHYFRHQTKKDIIELEKSLSTRLISDKVRMNFIVQ